MSRSPMMRFLDDKKNKIRQVACLGGQYGVPTGLGEQGGQYKVPSGPREYGEQYSLPPGLLGGKTTVWASSRARQYSKESLGFLID